MSPFMYVAVGDGVSEFCPQQSGTGSLHLNNKTEYHSTVTKLCKGQELTDLDVTRKNTRAHSCKTKVTNK